MTSVLVAARPEWTTVLLTATVQLLLVTATATPKVIPGVSITPHLWNAYD